MNARGTLPAPCRNGFTLLELLVVIVIIGILVAGVTLAIGVLGRDREAEDEARRLWAVMTQVKEESELTGRNIGVLVDQTGYEFLQFDAQSWSWKEITDDDLLSARQLPEGLFVRLALDGREVVLKSHAERLRNAEAQGKKKSNEVDANRVVRKSLQDADMAPQVMLLASGDVNSFEFKLEREGASDFHWRIFSKPDNSIDMESEDANKL